MTGVITAGYDFTLGDVQVYFYTNTLNPKVSLLDYFLGTTNYALPGDITTSTFSNMPNGYAWNQDNTLYTADPYLNFNLGDWINENTEIAFVTEGEYIEAIDLFAEYNETKWTHTAATVTTDKSHSWDLTDAAVVSRGFSSLIFLQFLKSNLSKQLLRKPSSTV